MCGIVGAIAERDILSILVDGLRRLEYRGYGSAGVAIQDASGYLQRIRSVGKVASLQQLLDDAAISGTLGIAHTRWATHGMPAERNAHPHMSGENIAVVHNGIIENHTELRRELSEKGYTFSSETDTEVIAHLLASLLKEGADLITAVRQTLQRLVGAYALAVASPDDSSRLIVARAGSPLVVGIGEGENFIASDVFALLPVTNQFIFLEEGDLAEISREKVTVYDANEQEVERPISTSELTASIADKGPYQHYMLKEIYEQPAVVAETLEGRIHKGRLLEAAFGHEATQLFDLKPKACISSPAAPAIMPEWWPSTGWRMLAFPATWRWLVNIVTEKLWCQKAPYLSL